MPAAALDVMKPFAWLAVIAFLTGFLSYLVLGQPREAGAQTGVYGPAAVSGPASDEWNVPKHI